MTTNLPRIMIAGLSGDSGKTITSLSLATALSRKGLVVSAFKKGPDYIDAAWLTNTSHAPCRNLDTYLVAPSDVYRAFTVNAQSNGVSIIEGNRGLFDGKDISGTHSSAGLAELLQAPVILVVDVTKTTRTIAALVKGCMDFDPELNIAGIILNKVAGSRHKNIITDSIKKYCDVPVLGAIPKLGDDTSIIPGRHLGLVTPSEHEKGGEIESKLLEIANDYLDIDGILNIANNAKPLEIADQSTSNEYNENDVKIGYFSDSVFTFYYPENLEALEKSGAELIAISSIDDTELPEIDGLYIGGGFPETQADRLVDNKSMIESVRKAAVSGLPIYAECGGLIYLSRTLVWNKRLYPMAGVFPLDLKINKKPVGHGYTMLKIDNANPFFEIGTEIKGHEFHYSGIFEKQSKLGFERLGSCMNVETGVGLGKKRDGLVFNNVLACYTHIHADGVKDWAPSIIKRARQFKEKRDGTDLSANGRSSGAGNHSINGRQLSFTNTVHT
ncbi:MAG: hydrogenobyrinic acid a,c-diamide synthase (glutamine-hydrolyzing) [candidate division Zixibacteria bacterium]|nr:hydrogenobyrinic acid a,c-diamide synthase (glutamine-hydrolyzing) [candidate division Zixibacteria bacterium]